MVSASSILYYLIRPEEVRSIIQWKVWHNPVHERREDKETVSQKACFDFLNLTSRSFSAVIQELHPELLLPICVFYLVLRGLDTIEDDMTIPIETKEPLLRKFDDFLERDGWTFDGNGPNEKDRDLLVHFHHVITEFKKIKPEYKKIIRDITVKMGNGMADYCQNAEVNSIKDYDLYCYYVAGVVGEGLTRLFVESKMGNPALLDRPNLHNSMGLFLQKTNIIRDVHEDWQDKRRFWPKEIWSKYVDNFDDLFRKENQEVALNCSSEMVLDALQHAPECLFYLAGLKEQSVFNFAAIPQSMAIATLELVFRDPRIFEKNIKISKGQACRLMVQSTQNLEVIYQAFRDYVRRIHKKNSLKDPNFLKISIACGKVEQFIESVFPSQKPPPVATDPAQQAEEARKAAEQAAKDQEARADTFYLMLAVFGFLFLMTVLMVGTAILFGARFDVAFAYLKSGKFRVPAGEDVDEVIRKYDHGEL